MTPINTPQQKQVTFFSARRKNGKDKSELSVSAPNILAVSFSQLTDEWTKDKIVNLRLNDVNGKLVS